MFDGDSDGLLVVCDFSLGGAELEGRNYVRYRCNYRAAITEERKKVYEDNGG